jgi:hypothetical protein
MPEKKSFFSPILLFFTHFCEKSNHFFPLIFFACVKNGRFPTRAPTPPPALLRKRPFLVTGKKMLEKKLLCF